jgi:hypothetical protein
MILLVCPLVQNQSETAKKDPFGSIYFAGLLSGGRGGFMNSSSCWCVAWRDASFFGRFMIAKTSAQAAFTCWSWSPGNKRYGLFTVPHQSCVPEFSGQVVPSFVQNWRVWI